MGEYSQIERKSPEKLVYPPARALYNPERHVFAREVESSKYSVLDIGCGEPPRISWKLKFDQLWVGCDPAISQKSGETIEVKSIFQTPIQGKLIVYNNIAAETPSFQPDIISVIAPNQKDVSEGNIFNYDLEKFLSDNKKQYLLSYLDTRTQEALWFGKSARQEVLKWMAEFNFKKIDVKPELPIQFYPNSADLGERNIHLFGIRNPKKS